MLWCAAVGTKEFKRNPVENAPVDIWFVVPNLNPVDCNLNLVGCNLNPVDCNCSQFVPLT